MFCSILPKMTAFSPSVLTEHLKENFPEKATVYRRQCVYIVNPPCACVCSLILKSDMPQQKSTIIYS